MRVSETGSQSEDFAWGHFGSDVALLEDDGNAYLYGPSAFPGQAPVEQYSISSGKMTYLISTRVGVQVEVGPNGTKLYSTDYSTYGTPGDTTGTDTTPFGFEGGYTDATGLEFLLNRYYDSSTGQFISRDSLASQSGEPYSYAGDDPLNADDPSGNLRQCFEGCDAPGSGDIEGPSGQLACSENCGQPNSGELFLWWLGQQTSSVQIFFECSAAHGTQACENFFAGQEPSSVVTSTSSGFSLGDAAVPALTLLPQAVRAVPPVDWEGLRIAIGRGGAFGIMGINPVTSSAAADIPFTPPQFQEQLPIEWPTLPSTPESVVPEPGTAIVTGPPPGVLGWSFSSSLGEGNISAYGVFGGGIRYEDAG